MAAQLQIDQVGLSTGSPGQSRTDGLATGAVVTLTNTGSGTTTTFTLLWVPPGDTSASATLAPTGDPKIWEFTPASGLYGSYLVELIEDLSLPSEVIERRVIVMRTPNRALVIPALNEIGDPNASLLLAGSTQIEAADNNATDFADANLNSVPYAAWWKAFHEIILSLDDPDLVLGSVAPEDVTKAAAAIGVSNRAARADHKHNITTGVPVNVTKLTAAEGVSTALARADHKHDVSTGVPVNVTKAAAAEGVSTALSRADHKHDVSTAVPVAVDLANAEGTSSSLARSDHVHQGAASVFGRSGAVVAVAGDYDSDKITNVSGVIGATVSDALDTLAAASPSIPDQRVLGNDSGVSAPATAITVHQELDWLTETEWFFDGVDDAINLGNTFDYERTNAFSVSAWPTTQSASDQTIISNQQVTTFRGWSVYIDNNGLVNAQLINTLSTNRLVVLAATAPPINNGQRHHVVFAYAGNSLLAGCAIYIDNVSYAVSLQSTPNNLSATIVSAANLKIGIQGDNATAPFHGTLEDVSLWDVQLSAGNVTTLYNNGTPGDLSVVGFVANLDAWWKLDSLDTTGAGGVSDYGPSNVDGTAEAGLAPAVPIGTIAVRGASLWELIRPGTLGFPLVSNGINAIPAYQDVGAQDISVVFTGGTLVNYQLPSGFRTGDILRVQLTGSTILDSISPPIPGKGFWFTLALGDQSGGNFSLTILDSANGFVGAVGTGIRAPGQPFGGATPNYTMQSEEEACIMVYTINSATWRVAAGTAAQAITGDITVVGGNGGPRDAQITSNVIVNGDINTSAAIALSKLATQATNTLVANATGSTAVPTAVAVGTNSVVGRVAGNMVAAALVDAQVAAGAAIALSKLATQAANSVVANATAGTAVPTAVAVGTNTVVGRVAGNVVAAALVDAQITTNAISAASQTQMAARTVKGNNTNATANEIDLTADQVREYIAGATLTQTTAQSQTNSTTNLTPGAYSIPANMAQVGSEYDLNAYIHASRGATATAANLIIELLINAVAIRTLTIPITVTASTFGHAVVRGKITVRTTGAGGTCMVTLFAHQTISAMTATPLTIPEQTAQDPAPSTTAPSTTAIDTTVTRSIELQARMDAPVTDLTIYAMDMTIAKVR